jgi:hypothetical protein
LLVTATAGLMVTMFAVTPWPVNVAYYVGVLFAMMFCFGVVNLPFLLATASGVMMAAGDIITTVAADTMPSAQAQASAFTTVAFVVAGAMICYRRDRAEHMSFASSHKLAIRNTQIEQERARLEVRVQERLAEREHGAGRISASSSRRSAATGSDRAPTEGRRSLVPCGRYRGRDSCPGHGLLESSTRMSTPARPGLRWD